MARTTLSPHYTLILPMVVITAVLLSLASLTGAKVIDLTSSTMTSPHGRNHHHAPSSTRDDLSAATTTSGADSAAVRNRDRQRANKHRVGYTTPSSDTAVTQRPRKLGRLFGQSGVVCPAGHFFSRTELSCSPCSTRCPANQIIRKPCSARRDTVCGPFSEFDKFRQTPAKDEDAERGGEADERMSMLPRGGRAHHHGGSHRKGGHHHHHHHRKGDHNQGHHTNPVSAELEGNPKAEEEPDLTSLSLDRARSQWRTLSIALIIVLSIVCSFVVAVGMYVFIACRRSRTEQRQFFREPELLTTRAYQDYDDVDAEPRYVQMYFPSDRDRNLRRARHLPVYQQIYTGSDSSEFPSLLTSSTTHLTAKEPSSGSGLDDENEDQYIYFNLPIVCKSAGEV